jgi:uncharacterized protein YgiM (DUF1202 family)
MKKSGQKRDDIHETPDVSHIQNPDVSHERSDVNLKSIIAFAAGLAVLTGVVLVLMSVMYNVLDERERKQEGQPAPMALTEKEHTPPEPRLQAAPEFGVDVDKINVAEMREKGYRVNDNGRVDLSLREPQAELKVVRERWQQELEGKQPDRQTGQARIPIDQAKQMLIQQGVPTRQPAQQQQGNGQAVQPMDQHGMEMPSFWSSGQQTEKRDQ